MADPQVEQFIRNIREKLPTYETPDRCAEELKKEYSQILGTLPESVIANIDAAREAVRARLENVEILRPCSIIKEREEWYTGPSATDHHWPALESYLRQTKGWDSDTVDSIDSTSSEIVSLLANPGKDKFRCRGLVVGYVQSGKTANMTAVIAKAVDAGYNLIVVLAGMTNKLRAQTQRRLEEDVVMRHRHLWQLYTTNEDDGDFVEPRNNSFTMPVPGRAQLAVVKKVSSRLEAFHRLITRSPAAVRREIKVLLIDDECDQASVNSAKDDYDITRINEEIRKILAALPAVSYVGYTATPFANVFIDPFPHNKKDLDDLYPEDFITALPKPESYFGPEEVFGSMPEDADMESESEQGRDMIRLINEKELTDLVVRKAAEKEAFKPKVTESLAKALYWFIGSCAIRLARGHEDKHMTMLVHTSPYIAQHDHMAEAITEHLNSLKETGNHLAAISAIVAEEYARVPPDDKGYVRPAPTELKGGVEEVLKRLEVVVENGASTERLDYTSQPKIYVVVGGAVLARGLTLEGLAVSFFLRTSRQYDTLLQMGRWFGYRHGYEDLPRLWTTEELASSFRELARIEAEIREDIELYRVRKITPLDLAVRVRSIPGMAITSATKMRHAYRTSISYEGRHVQTIRFEHRNDEVVAGNWKAASRLVDTIGAKNFESRSRGFLAAGIEPEVIRTFLSQYSISSRHMDLRKEHILGFVDQYQKDWSAWNVAIVQPGKGAQSTRPLGAIGTVFTVTRSRLRELADGHADIKALMSKSDVLMDARTIPNGASALGWKDLKSLRPASVPLLLLYPIDAQSAPQSGRTQRVPLEAVGDLLGIGIIFPGEVDQGGEYYAVELHAPTPEELDEEEFVEDEMAELINEPSN